MNLNDFKSDWQSMDKPSSFDAENQQFATMLNNFEDIQRKTRKENIAISIAFLLTIAFLWGMFWFMDDASWWVWSGIMIMTVEMIVAGIFAWYRNTSKKWSNLRQNSRRYLSSAIRKLKCRKVLMLIIIPVYTLLLIVALNLIYVGVLSDLRLMWRWVIHMGVSIMIAGFVAFEVRRRYNKEQQTIDPLIRDFESMKEGLE
ncbi:hypothetical protein LX73_1802 [Fodinibius salinus]|uniref:Uncharacterized protein n=1 Tax=Fodinibius salinus TaxID=860790 RepID=A0A5D3YKN8_9BACT|nr:hypothetical protein LX73_1802 [Fodinibius salinus]